MGIRDFNKSAKETDDGKRARLISLLSDELEHEWIEKNHEWLMRVMTALTSTHFTLTEENVWELICANASDEWREASAERRAAKEAWNDDRPLGLLGLGSAPTEVDQLKEAYDSAYAQFIIVNEGLQQREDLKRLLGVLMVQKRMLENSATITAKLRRVATAFEQLLHLTDDAPEKGKKKLCSAFNTVAKKGKSIKPITLTPVPVPWSPGI